MNLTAIDPGTRLCGWAEFEHNELWSCGLVRSKAKTLAERAEEMSEELHQLRRAYSKGNLSSTVIEMPRVYDRRRWRGDPNDLVNLAVVVGACIPWMSKNGIVRLTYPDEWKGNVPKKIVHKRMLKKDLNEKERAIVEAAGVPKSLRHNMLDAVALGLRDLGR